MSEENRNTEPNESANSGALFDILGKLMSSKAGSDTQGAPQGSPATDLGALSSVLSNPELISKLPELLSVISPLLGGLSGIGGSPSGGAAPASAKAQAPIAFPAQAREAQNRAALLCALKPYLKKERQEAIDYMIKLSRLGDILKTL